MGRVTARSKKDPLQIRAGARARLPEESSAAVVRDGPRDMVALSVARLPQRHVRYAVLVGAFELDQSGPDPARTELRLMRCST